MEVENDESFVDSANEAVQNFNSKTIDINATESVLTSEIDLLFQGPETKFRTDGASKATEIVLRAIVKACSTLKFYSLLSVNLQVAVKRRAQLKQAFLGMFKEAMECMNQLLEAKDEEAFMGLCEGLRSASDGRIYLEMEHAKVTQVLSRYYESKGDLVKASKVLQEIQVETVGSMSRREKADIIIDQMRLCLSNEDYLKCHLISQKINLNTLQRENFSDVKARFYRVMAEYHMQEADYYNVALDYQHILVIDSKEFADEEKENLLRLVCIFSVLSKYDSDTQALWSRVLKHPLISDIGQHRDLLKSFERDEVMMWEDFVKSFGSLFSEPLITSLKHSSKCQEELRFRVVEHNLRVASHAYSRVSLDHLATILALTTDETEETLGKLVHEGQVICKIDRPARVVEFKVKRPAAEVLNDWSANIKSLLFLIETTSTQISKERMRVTL